MEPINTVENPDEVRSRPGKPYPLGATWDTEGVNFALFSEHATGVTLCLFDANDHTHETHRIPLTERTEHIWHIYLESIPPGQLYGYRVEGPFEPSRGLLFNPNKLLLDPYAKAISGPILSNLAQLGFSPDNQDENRYSEPQPDDSAPFVPKSVVIDSSFDWDDDQRPDIPLNRTVIYELHVKGFTQQHPELSKKIRGTYAGLSSPESIEYLKSLGITTVELMPIHQFTGESYWGYNSIGYFAPHSEYASKGDVGHAVVEFKEMVKALHKAGIEVVLDVVYNHTAEGNQHGPTLSFRGIDNPAYYWLVEDNELFYMDYTGTGNTLNMNHPRTLQLVMDSLRYWVNEMHVDGFRFDLATALAQSLSAAGQLSSFLETIQQDPVLSQVKLIAEPWDIQSYHVGNFPVNWSEWNGKYRDCVRGFWKGDEDQAGEFAARFLGSPDLYNDGRQPANSINLITAHDGFTLNDLVSYNDKHNDANGEENRDGANDNRSWNMGAEGPTDDKTIQRMREQQKRNFLATLLLSQGTPMLLMGDECSRTQQGNNNAYAQDNEISWFNWEWSSEQQALFDYTRQLTALRQEIPLLRRRKFFQQDEFAWLRNDGKQMTETNWHDGITRCLGLLIDGRKVDEQDENGDPITQDRLLVLVNAFWEPLPFRLPKFGKKKARWQVLVNTDLDANVPYEVSANEPFEIQSRSLVLLKLK
ncbi:glycogen debranching protein GlgX [Larkinella terrae]|uniref:Glycogen debranching protein GlgX n=1 Tax=Larkinella terrae TaxID=2025311 RepID=A0A7K0ELT8_9BACT|nr:glycogen debranching protein GlgX [Larkinella terrae]MRS62491.1 glycogen debranching protein GlgX [Larkinella terrae]